MAFHFDPAQVPVWTGYLAFATAASVAVRTWIIKPVKNGLKTIHDILDKIDFVKNQFYNNGGSTLRDTVDKLTVVTADTNKAVQAIGARQRAIIQTDSLGMYEVDEKGFVTFVNPAWCDITGLSEDEGMGLGWMSAIPDEDRAAAQRQRADGSYLQDYTGQYRFRRPATGEIVNTLVRFKWNRDSAGKPIGGFGTLERL